MKKIRVGIIFGGKSAEHEVSLQSAKNVVEAIDKNKYEPVLIGIDKTGRWFMNNDSPFLLDSSNSKTIKLNNESSQKVAIIPQSDGMIINLAINGQDIPIDVVFPILHGPLGEDGTIQGLLKLANIPFVGADVLGSAVGMDKDVMKRLLRDAGIPIAKFITLINDSILPYDEVKKELGSTLFVKPANMGSSVGVSKVKNEKEYKSAVHDAFRYDRKILIEENIKGREIECAVLGNEKPAASVVGEILPKHDFYSYEAKYIDENGAGLEIPANLSAEESKRIQELAVRTFQILGCEGFGRIDCFLKPNGEVVVNEINTIPGFTSISMYPKLWQASGLSYTDLIDKLIQLAIDRFNKEQSLKTSYV